MRVFVLYRPRWPSLRAQALQVFYSAHALARRGVEVTVAYHPGGGDLWEWFGRAPLPQLRLLRLPRGGTAASVAFRVHLLRWGYRPGVLLAREKRLAVWASRFLPRHPLVLEAHEVDSLQGRPTFALERRVLGRAAALICNCEGVREALDRLHPLPPRVRVIPNAGPPPIRGPRGEGVVYAGSLLVEKDVETLARAAPRVGGITLLGDHEPGRVARLQALAGGRLKVMGPVAPAAMSRRLATFEVGLVPLGDGWFGRELTSPLKAYAYRSAGIAIAGAGTPALRRTLGAHFVPWRVGDPDSVARAVHEARERWASLRDGPVRTWEERAAEVEAVLGAVWRERCG